MGKFTRLNTVDRTKDSLLRQLDLGLLVDVLALLAVSLAAIASATYSLNPGDRLYYVRRQILWICLGSVAAILVRAVDYRTLVAWGRPLYLLNLAMLAAVMVIGKEAQGAQRWIQLGPFPFQPSEMAKLLLIISLAGHLGHREEPIRSWRQMIPYAVHVGPPLLLVLLQPDLGTSLVLLAILFGMLYAAGVPGQRLVLLVGTGLGTVAAVIVGHFRWGLPLPLRDYQLNRLLVFLEPGRDPLGAGYHLAQSKIAIGSGALWGKGLFFGTQNQLNFLPNRHTDFIFSVIGEELGFVGGIVVLGLYFYLIYRILQAGVAARDPQGSLLCVGVASMFVFHVLVNIGMTVGIMPVTGIPLPFVSYGGSNLLTGMMALGLVLNVHGRRRRIRF